MAFKKSGIRKWELGCYTTHHPPSPSTFFSQQFPAIISAFFSRQIWQVRPVQHLPWFYCKKKGIGREKDRESSRNKVSRNRLRPLSLSLELSHPLFSKKQAREAYAEKCSSRTGTLHRADFTTSAQRVMSCFIRSFHSHLASSQQHCCSCHYAKNRQREKIKIKHCSNIYLC